MGNTLGGGFGGSPFGGYGGFGGSPFGGFGGAPFGGFGGGNPFQQLFQQFQPPQPPDQNAMLASLFQALQPLIAEGFGLGPPPAQTATQTDSSTIGTDTTTGGGAGVSAPVPPPAGQMTPPAAAQMTAPPAPAGFQGNVEGLLHRLNTLDPSDPARAGLIQQAQGRDQGASFNQAARDLGYQITPTKTGGFSYDRPVASGPSFNPTTSATLRPDLAPPAAPFQAGGQSFKTTQDLLARIRRGNV